MKFSTFVIHGGEGYVPEIAQYIRATFHVKEVDLIPKDVPARGYNDYGEDFDQPNPGYIVTVEGLDEYAVERALMMYLAQCAYPHGADDDTFDYWPSHVDGLLDLITQFGDPHMIAIAERLADYCESRQV